MNHIKAIIHDWDDIITNSFEVYSQFYFELAKLHSLQDPKRAEIRKYWGGTIEDITQNLWPQVPRELIEDYVKNTIHSKERKHMIHKIEVFPRVRETLQRLSHKYKLGVLSSGRRDAIDRIYKRFLMSDGYYHKFILDARDTKVHKPNPRVFDKVFELLEPYGISDAQTVYIGDHLNDWIAARDRGLDFIAITTGVTTKDDFLKYDLEEKYIYENFSDLLDIFDA